MEEKEKKAKTPRAPRKAKAATVQETAQTTEAEVATATAEKTQTEKTPTRKKIDRKPPKKSVKKSVPEAQEAAQADGQETPAEKQPAKKKAAPKRATKKHVKEAAETVTEQPQTESVESMPVAVQEPTPETPKKTAKKGGRAATKTKKSKETVAAEAQETQPETAEEAPAEAVQEAPEATVQEAPAAVTEEQPKQPKKQPKKTAAKGTAAKRTASAATDGAQAPTKPAKEEHAPVTATKAEKKDAIKGIVRALLKTPCKWAELLDNAAKEYKEKYPSKENERDSDVKGRIGSVIDLMKKEGEVVVENGVARLTADEPAMEEKPQKEAPVSATNEQSTPVETVETATEIETEAPQEAPKTEGQEAPKAENVAVTVVEAATPAPVYDMSALFDRKKPTKKEPKKEVKTQVATIAAERVEEQSQTVTQEAEETAAPVATTPPVQQTETAQTTAQTQRKTERKTPIQGARRTDVPKRVMRGRLPVGENRDPLKEAFLRKLRSLGGDYFEYYSVYLLERYSRKNGRRLESLRISGGEHDGGIDGEIELTDRLGFRETIYIQAKNWAPTDEKWMVGETLLQQFIGAVAYRQAKEGKQHCRGMFITTSCFTTGAKEMLEQMSDQFVGYDGDDLYETAKECQFGLVKGANGEWKLDEELLSGERALFYML